MTLRGECALLYKINTREGRDRCSANYAVHTMQALRAMVLHCDRQCNHCPGAVCLETIGLGDARIVVTLSLMAFR